jgi:hypothetical protein
MFLLKTKELTGLTTSRISPSISIKAKGEVIYFDKDILRDFRETSGDTLYHRSHTNDTCHLSAADFNFS